MKLYIKAYDTRGHEIKNTIDGYRKTKNGFRRYGLKPFLQTMLNHEREKISVIEVYSFQNSQQLYSNNMTMIDKLTNIHTDYINNKLMVMFD